MALFVRRRWPKVAAAVAGVAALGLVVFLVVRDPSSGAPSSRRTPGFDDLVEQPSLPPETTPPPIAVAAVLTAPDAELKTYADQPVAGTSVSVLAPVGPSAAWIGDSAEDRLLLVLVGVENPFAFTAGDRVTFTGVVRHGATAEFGTSLGLSAADAAAFAKQGAYVEVTGYVAG